MPDRFAAAKTAEGADAPAGADSKADAKAPSMSIDDPHVAGGAAVEGASPWLMFRPPPRKPPKQRLDGEAEDEEESESESDSDGAGGDGDITGASSPSAAASGSPRSIAGRAEVEAAIEAFEKERASLEKPVYTGSGVGLLYDARMARHHSLDDDEHPEAPLRIVRIFRRLESEGIVDRCVRVPCRPATREELISKHASKHVDTVLAVGNLTEDEALAEQGKFRSVFLCPETTESALLSAGAVLEATERVCAGDLAQAVCVTRPPGHHAEVECAMGFCLFGNVGIAAAEAQNRGWSKRTLIIDWDIHHGNGTQQMFYEDSAVLFFSVHRYDSGRYFPGGPMGHFTSHGEGEGAGYSVNVPWDWRGAAKRGHPPPGDGEYMDVWERVLLPIAADFKPDLIYISAGFDAAEGDPLGGCLVSPAGYHELTRRLMDLAGGRMVVVLEGGYNLSSICDSMAATAHALLGDPPPPVPKHLSGEAAAEGSKSSDKPQFPPAHPYHADVVSKVRHHLSEFWPSLRDEKEALAHAGEAVEIRVPAASLHGTLAEMEKALRDHVDAEHSYEKLRARQQTLLFQLEEMPKPPPHVKEQVGWTAMRSSLGGRGAAGGGASGKGAAPFLVAVVHIVSVEQAVQNAGRAFRAGMSGVFFVNSGHAHSPPEAALNHLAVQRTNLKGPTGGAAGKAGRAQLEALQECFAAVRDQYSEAWLGVSLPQLPPAQAFKWVSSHCPSADGLWLHHLPCKPADLAWEKSQNPDGSEASTAVRLEKWLTDAQPSLKAVKRERQIATWKGLVFACIAGRHNEQVHHHQEVEDHMDEACQALLSHTATLASSACDVVITGSACREDPTRPCPAAKLWAMEVATPLALLSSCCASKNESPEAVGNLVDLVLVDAAALGASATPGGAGTVGAASATPAAAASSGKAAASKGGEAAAATAAECPPPDFDSAELRKWVIRWRGEEEDS